MYDFTFYPNLSDTLHNVRKIQLNFIVNVLRYAQKEPLMFVKGKKVNFTLQQATKAQTGNRCIALLFN